MSEEIEDCATDSHRFFRASPEVYEGMRQYLDAEFGHPKGGTTTCVPPLSIAPKKDGLVYASVSWSEAAKAGDLLEDLLDAANVEEVVRSDWESAVEGSL